MNVEPLRRAQLATADALLSATLAPACVSCHHPLSSPLAGPACEGCLASIRPLPSPLCALCGDALAAWRVLCLSESRCARCRREPPAFDAGRAAGHYDGALRDIVHAFKFDGRRRLARVLGERMREAGASLLEDAGCVVPVPLHPWRRLTRGFNQAQDLAVTLGPPVVAALWRLRATASQSGLAATGRRRNVRGAFCLSPLVSRRTLALRVEGRIVVLVDDVVTTGATLDACARVLKAAGAREVRILTAARATLRQ